MFMRVRVHVCSVHVSVKTHLAPACQRQTHPSVHVYDAHVLLSFIFQNDSNLTFFLFVLFLSVHFLFFFPSDFIFLPLLPPALPVSMTYI